MGLTPGCDCFQDQLHLEADKAVISNKPGQTSRYLFFKSMSMHTVIVLWGANMMTFAVEHLRHFEYPSFSAHVHYPHFHLEKEAKPTGSNNSLLSSLTFVVQWCVWRRARAIAFCWIIWVWGAALLFWQAEVVRCDFLIAFKIPEGTCGKKRREN